MKAERLPLVAALSLAACSGTASPQKPIAPLSATDQAGNASKIAALIVRQCGAVATDPARFSWELHASGWQLERKQAASQEEPLSLDLWQFPNGELMRGELVKGRVWTCTIAIDAPAAPSVAQMQAALADFAGKPDAVKLQPWRPDMWHDAQISTDVGNADQGGGLFIHVEISRLPWWRAMLG